VIDKPILKLLNIEEDTLLELSIEDGSLVMRPVSRSSKKKLSPKERQALLDEVADKIMDTYEDVFKKLAK